MSVAHWGEVSIKNMATSLRRTLVRHIFAQHQTAMEKQIASYLFQNKTCPLPGLGTLSIMSSSAESDFTSKTFSAPKPTVHFTHTETDSSGLLNYLSVATGADKYEATEALSHFCDDLKQKIADEQKVELDSIGNFFVDSAGKINFKHEELSAAFTQPVFAERVIHPDAEHQILVGDKESTNTEMTEYLAPKEVIKSRWWIWAIVLGAIGLVALLIYFSEFNGAYPFGNVIKN
jgi:nucleoid DNA-binding protein